MRRHRSRQGLEGSFIEAYLVTSFNSLTQLRGIQRSIACSELVDALVQMGTASSQPNTSIRAEHVQHAKRVYRKHCSCSTFPDEIEFMPFLSTKPPPPDDGMEGIRSRRRRSRW